MNTQSINMALLLLLVSIVFQATDAFIMPQLQSSATNSCQSAQRSMALHSSDPTSAVVTENNVTDEDEDDDDDEYEYVNYDFLEEADFQGSEWLLGTNMNKSPDRIDETWVRLAIDNDGKQVAIWGDNAQGTWKFDKASQFLSMSKNNILGKKIWAGVVEDFYFSQGSVRGWTFFSAAAVLGQWQAKRLGVDAGEAGTAPWFEAAEEEKDIATNGET